MSISANTETFEQKQVNGYLKYIDDECIICSEAITKENFFDNPLFKTSCEHVFHKICLDEWCSKSETCPVCRTNISYEQEVADWDKTRKSINLVIKKSFEKKEPSSSGQNIEKQTVEKQNIEKDVEFARKLQKELDQSESDSEGLDPDELFARELQQQLENEDKAEKQRQIDEDFKLAQSLREKDNSDSDDE